MKKELITKMVDRFLEWNLPGDFSPGCYIRFGKDLARIANTWPIGTNLLTAAQAYRMFEYVLAEIDFDSLNTECSVDGICKMANEARITALEKANDALARALAIEKEKLRLCSEAAIGTLKESLGEQYKSAALDRVLELRFKIAALRDKHTELEHFIALETKVTQKKIKKLKRERNRLRSEATINPTIELADIRTVMSQALSALETMQPDAWNGSNAEVIGSQVDSAIESIKEVLTK